MHSSPKVLREQRINQWIDGRVAVSQPEQHGEDDGADTVPAEGPHDVHAEEGKPAEDEPSHYDAEGLGCFSLHTEAFYLETLYGLVKLMTQEIIILRTRGCN